ncbi:PilZ domain-containing protein [Microvirga guangxiensis]|uniref:PilZ domain-containing protein n=1 Tax=Microvirga guangxiensis TaxID=549386 RepID=A0A1G5JIB9_9HYPH|nr:PilZ domain-containing protein [Microvirga guangxiensis]SCY87631.1 PilZ domain-containing protein [Microvirga guangxiensis]
MSSCDQIANRRQAKRFRTQHLAKIVLGPDSMISCRIEDISAGGARIALEHQMTVPESFELFIAAHELQVHRAHMCWRQQGSLGVSFTRSTENPGQTRALLNRIDQDRTSFQDEYEKLRVELERDEKPDSRILVLKGSA